MRHAAIVILAVISVFGSSDVPHKSRVTTPVIVKRLVITNITADVPLSVLYTPPKAGIYRLTSVGNYVSTTDGANGRLCGVIHWTGHHDSSIGVTAPLSRTMFTEAFAGGGTCLEAGNDSASLQSTWVMQVNGNTPITYQMSITQLGGDTFEVYFILERLR